MQGFMVYAKPEVDRRHFHQRHEALLKHYTDRRGSAEWGSSKVSKKTRSKLRNTMQPSVLLFRRDSRPNSGAPPTMPAAQSQRAQQQYDVLFEETGGIGAVGRHTDSMESMDNPMGGMGSGKGGVGGMGGMGGGRTERDIYVSNVVGDYLDSVMPEESLNEKSFSSTRFIGMLLRHHEYTSMFFGASLDHPRLMRYTHLCLGILLVVFFDTLFFGVFYPDSGVCDALLTEETCLAEDSRISSTTLCLWADSCSLNQPPEDFIFICIIVLVTVTLAVPITFCYDLLLFYVCFRRPHLGSWGWSSEDEEEYLGRSTRKTTLSKNIQQSPIQLLYEHARAGGVGTGIGADAGAGAGEEGMGAAASLYNMVEGLDFSPTATVEGREGEGDRHKVGRAGDRDLIARQVYEQYMPSSFEADTLLAQVTAYLATHAASPDPWQTSSHSVVQAAKTAAIQKTVGIYPDGAPVRLTLREYCLYGTPRNKLIHTIENARKRSRTIAQALGMFGEGEVQNKDSTLIQYFILEQFSFLKQFVLKKHLFDYAASSPLPVSPYLWGIAWVWIVLSHVFFIYWALVWTLSQGGMTVRAWGINLAFGILQDIFVVHAFRVYLIYSLSMVSIKPQLKYIYRVLNKVAISYAQDELGESGGGGGGNSDAGGVGGSGLAPLSVSPPAPTSAPAPVHSPTVRVVQHTSPACRAARLRVSAHLATGNILRHVDDVDVEMCSIGHSMHVSVLAGMRPPSSLYCVY
ncbi:hypothetical protein B484DRAFT_69627 [Ochromonadaceae sp. CCMP2298]|nr:hypothetical protein B484DRAFT_69627 [Ochromonadaceae sp. CCMP2298]